MLLFGTAAAGALLALYLVNSMFGGKKLDVRGKHVLITGGSSGIGLAIATELSKQGAQLTIFARSQSKLDAALKQMGAASAGPRAQAFPVDVTQLQQASHHLYIVCKVSSVATDSTPFASESVGPCFMQVAVLPGDRNLPSSIPVPGSGRANSCGVLLCTYRFKRLCGMQKQNSALWISW